MLASAQPSEFEQYMLTFFSFIFGVVVTEYLSGIESVIRKRGKVTLYWVHIGWVLVSFVLVLQNWWGLWKYKAAISASFSNFFLILLNPIAFHVSTLLLIPDVSENQLLDCKQFYFKKFNRIALFFSYIIAKHLIDSWVVLGEGLIRLDNAVRVSAGVLLAAVAFVPRRFEWVHALAISTAGILLVVFIVGFTHAPVG